MLFSVNNKIIYGFIIIIIIVILFKFRNVIYDLNTDEGVPEELLKTVELSKSNFVYISNYNINSNIVSLFCNEIKADNCEVIGNHLGSKWENPECARAFTYNFKYKLINMPVDPYYNNLKCKAYDNGNIIKERIGSIDGGTYFNEEYTFSGGPNAEIKELMIPVDVTKDSNIVFCCQMNNTDIVEQDYTYYMGNKKFKLKKGDITGILSNEVCLDPIKINACNQIF